MRTVTDVSGEWTRDDDRDPRGLRVVDTPMQGAVDIRVPVERPVLLGREPGPKGLAILDPRMSSSHVSIYPEPSGDLLFRDMGSKNGTFVNGQRAVGGRLTEGDVLRMGSTLLVVSRRGPDFAYESAKAGLIGDAPPFREALERARSAASRDMPVLIQGETGSGKEGIARYIHTESGRRGAFIAVNCAALNESMADAALFGHERGAFTGATQSRKGFFGEAAGGTLFLDEIGDLPQTIQPRLLRALEQREITPVGAARPARVDVRVVAATHVDLRRAVNRETFRNDLYARLAGWPVELPALRDRREDILRLARFFLGRAPSQVPYGEPLFDADLGEAMLLSSWPFNVRELRQVAEAIAIEGTVPYGYDDLPRQLSRERSTVEQPSPFRHPLAGHVSSATTPKPRRRVRPSRTELALVLSEEGFNVSAVARRYDRDRKQIYRWLTHYDIPLEDQ
ncbi:MAG: DNA-binding NtrC family response regulator [Myxococcota bacterium]|jgi:DNA-binding NtrC family response regulator